MQSGDNERLGWKTWIKCCVCFCPGMEIWVSPFIRDEFSVCCCRMLRKSRFSCSHVPKLHFESTSALCFFWSHFMSVFYCSSLTLLREFWCSSLFLWAVPAGWLGWVFLLLGDHSLPPTTPPPVRVPLQRKAVKRGEKPEMRVEHEDSVKTEWLRVEKPLRSWSARPPLPQSLSATSLNF